MPTPKNPYHIQTQSLVWHNNTALFRQLDIAQWLLDDQSLTAKLKQQYSDFEVQVLSQQSGQPHYHEHLLFEQHTSHYTLREVLLLGNGIAKVYARSVIPDLAELAFLQNLDNRPLGEILFNHPEAVRGQMQYTQTSNGIWGRRSIFKLKQAEVLVCEFFLFV